MGRSRDPGNGDANILNVLQGTPAVTMTASNLSVSAGVGNVTVTLTVGQSDTALTCTTGTNGICTDTTDKVSIPPSSAVAYKVENNSGQGVAALTGMQTKLK
jgi:hypothetical protein